jgi:hypothetical protein
MNMDQTRSTSARGRTARRALQSIVTARHVLARASLAAALAWSAGASALGCSLLVTADDLAGAAGAEDARPPILPGRDASRAGADGGGAGSGDGTPPLDGGSGATCLPTDAVLCGRLGLSCGSVTTYDDCGQVRVIASCGLCNALTACGAGGLPNLCGLSVVGFTLIDTSITNVVEGAPVAGFDPLVSGVTIDRAITGSRLSVRANTNPAVVGRVRFTLDGSVYKTEHSAPYALAGDDGKGVFTDPGLSAGTHTVTATPYDADDAGAATGVAATVTFTIR